MAGRNVMVPPRRGWKIIPSIREALLLAAAVLAVGVAAVIMLGIIPPTRDIWVPHANHAEGAVPAWWVSTSAHLVVAAVLVAAAALGGLRLRVVRWVLVILGVGALMQALMSLDALAAWSDIPDAALNAKLAEAKNWVRVAIVGEVLVGLLIIGGTLLPGGTIRSRTGARPAPQP